MRLHRISLRDYKGVRAVRIEPREHGVTIIEGDNEVGKSSIAEAIWLIFEQNDDSASQLVRGLKPVDRDAATEIEVELSTGPYRFTYFKRFHRGSRTELRITEPRRETLSGREAHVRARQILDETIDRALWEALRLQQGANLDPIAAGQHASLLGALDLAAGQVPGGDREETLFDRIEQEYDRYFTPSGREKGSGDGPNAPRLRSARDAADTEVARLCARIASLEERSSQAAMYQAEAAANAARLAAERQTVAELAAGEAWRREQRQVAETLNAEVRVHEAGLRASQAAREARARDAAAIAPRQEEQLRLNARFEALAGPLAQAVAARDDAVTASAVSQKVLEDADAGREAAERQLQLASADFTALTMGERLERLERNEPEVLALSGWLAQCKVDRALVAKMEQARQRLDRIEARREAEGASVEVFSEAPLDLEINGKPAHIEPGRPARGTVLGDSQLVLPGGVRITIRAGAVAREVAAEAAAIGESLRLVLAESGVESVEAARVTLDERLVNEERLRGLQQQLKADLRDLSSVEELRQKLGRERARVAHLRHESGGAVPSIDAAKAALDSASRAASDAELAARSARTTQNQAESALAGLENERQHLGDHARNLGDEISRLEASLAERRSQDSDEAIDLACAEHSRLFEGTAASLAEATQRLDAMADRSAELGVGEESVRALEAEGSRLSAELSRLLGVLEDAGAEGLHGQLVEAEQRLAVAETELAAFLRRASAARTLFEAMKAARDRARANYAAPLRSNIEALGKQVFGDSFSVELTEDLRIARVSREGLSLELAQLSVGIREQLAVLTRLACAALVSASGGAPVVLDDIFGWADPSRLRSLGPILAATAAESQVLLFTCSPERFATVAPARVISLPSCEVTERVVVEHSGPPSRPSRGEQPGRRSPQPVTLPPQATFDLFGEPQPAAAAQN